MGPQGGGDKYYRDIEKWKKLNTIPQNLEISFVPYSSYANFLIKLNKKFFSNFGPIGLPLIFFYCLGTWRKKVNKKIKGITNKKNIKIIHYLNPISARANSIINDKNIKIIWGPTGGLRDIPLGYLSSLSFPYNIIELYRNISNFYYRKISWKFKKNVSNASLISLFDKSEKKFFNSEVIINSETACDPQEIDFLLRKNKTITIGYAGQITDRKQVDIIAKALKNLDKVEGFSVKIAGEGPLAKSLIDEFNKLNLCSFDYLGWQDSNQMKNFFNTIDLLILPSLREGTPNVVLEALSNGVPVIAHKIGGIENFLDEDNSFLIKLINKEQSILYLTQILDSIKNDPSLLFKKQAFALNTAKLKNWENKTKEWIDVYNRYL